MSSSVQIDQLIEAVAVFLRQRALPALEGDLAFETRVSINALELAVRELRQPPEVLLAHAERLEALLGRTGSRQTLDATLCEEVREGRIDESNDALIAHLLDTTRAAVTVDQPRYSALRRNADLQGAIADQPG